VEKTALGHGSSLDNALVVGSRELQNQAILSDLASELGGRWNELDCAAHVILGSGVQWTHNCALNIGVDLQAFTIHLEIRLGNGDVVATLWSPIFTLRREDPKSLQ
jgi:hypothetical protein